MDIQWRQLEAMYPKAKPGKFLAVVWGDGGEYGFSLGADFDTIDAARESTRAMLSKRTEDDPIWDIGIIYDDIGNTLESLNFSGTKTAS